MRWLLLLLAACNEFYGLDDTRVASLEPPECAGIRFEIRETIMQFTGDGLRQLDPQLSRDGSELWFVHEMPDRVMRGVRGSDGNYTIATADLGPYAPTKEPALTADGRRLMFISDGDIIEAVRDDPTSATFDSFRLVTGLDTFGSIVSHDLSWDGLRIYYTGDSDNQLWTAERATRDDPFTNQRMLATNVEYPTLSGDELEMFYNHGTIGNEVPLYYRSRPSRDAPWSAEALVLDNAYDADISATSDVMIAGRSGDLVLLARPCD